MSAVYKAINKVQAELAKEGISKSRRNQQQGYNFRGIDEIYNVVSPLLAEAGLCILPRILKREQTERQTRKGDPLFAVVVEAEFDFVSSEDGSAHTVRTFGEAMDSADKATNKAMSAAYKYAVMQAFAIPTEGDNDADAHTHEVAPRQQQAAAPQSKAPENSLRDYIGALAGAATIDELAEVFTSAKTFAGKYSDPDALRQIVEAKDKRKLELAPAEGGAQ